MPSSLEAIRRKFVQRLHLVDSAFERHLIEPVTKLRTDRYALQEGLISQLWQYWCVFCRDVVMASVQGATTSLGALTSCQLAGRPEMEVAYVAMRLARGKSIGSIRQLSGSHLEPTWGDPNKINLIASGIGCSNEATLLSAFGFADRIIDLQLCRNACAHLNASNIHLIRGAKVRYIASRFSHPSELMFWEEPSTRDFVWRAWVEEMEIISEAAVQ